MKRPPCKKNGIPCTKRKPGCQDHCPEMHPFKEERKLISEKRMKDLDVNEAYASGIIRAQKSKRKRGH